MSMAQYRGPAVGSPPHKPSFSGSLPGLPDWAYQRSVPEDETLPLPDHFPEPYSHDSDPEGPADVTLTSTPASPRSSATVETGQTLVYCSPSAVLNGQAGGQGKGEGKGETATEGVRRITDKYAAPGSLVRHGSVSSYSRTASVRETLPSSPTPSITITTSPAPTTHNFPFPPINGGFSTSDIAGVVSSKGGPHCALNGGHSTGALPASEGPHSNSSTLQRHSATRHSCSSSRNSGGVNNFSGVSLVGPSRRQTVREGRLSSSSDALSPHYTTSSASDLFADVIMRNGSGRGVSPLLVSAFSDGSSEPCESLPSPGPPSTAGSVRGSGGSLRGVPVTGGCGTLPTTFNSVSGIALSSLGDGVSAQDIHQVEMFYRSHKTEVIVCHSLANFYIGTAAVSHALPSSAASTPKAVTKNPKDRKGKGGGKDKDKDKAAEEKTAPSSPQSPQSPQTTLPASGSEAWHFVTTGIPLLVLDTGEHHRTRQLTVVVAEKGTGFELWRDVVSHLTNYSCPHDNFHTLRLSSDTNKLGGFSFDDSKAAAEFASSLKKLLADPEDELLMLSKKGKKKKKRLESFKKKLKYKPPKKTDISQPCCFEHVTKIERPVISGVSMPLPPNSFPPAPSGSVSSLCDLMHDRLSLPLSRDRSASSELSDGASTVASVDH